MKKLLPSLFAIGSATMLLAGPDAARAATSVTTNGITFTFDTNYTTGRFVDDEPWVVENAPGGGVTVVSMTPAYADGKHGYSVNQVDFQNSENSLDDRIFGIYVEPPPLPRTFQANDSILKAESLDIYQEDCRKDYTVKTCILQSSVLTVLAQAPPAGSFRPPYAGTEKPIFSASGLDYSVLPRVPEVEDQVSFADAEAVFPGGVWLDNIASSRNSYGHPREAMRTVGGDLPATYGSNLAKSITTAMLRTMHDNTDEEKRFLVERCVQAGIDYYYMIINGMTYPANGGIGAGRKLPIFYAGVLLGHAGMMNIGYDYPGDVFQEDGFHFYGIHGEAIWGEVCAEGNYDRWVVGSAGGKACRDPDGIVDGSRCQGGTYCSAHGGPHIPQPTLVEQRATGLFSYGSYQRYTGQYYGAAVGAQLLGVETEWNHPAFFDYVARLGTPPWNYYCGAYCSDYMENMHKAHGSPANAGGGP